MRKTPKLSRRRFLSTTIGAGVAVAAGRSGAAQAQAAVPAVNAPTAGPDADQRPHPHDGRAQHRREHGHDPQRADRRSGDRDRRRGAAPQGTHVIDLRGRTVDTRAHRDAPARARYGRSRRLPHAGTRERGHDPRRAGSSWREQRKTVPEGQWITAIGAANTNLWAEHRFPTLQELDEAVPDRPVLLYQGFNGAAATNYARQAVLRRRRRGAAAASRLRRRARRADGAIGPSNAADRRSVHQHAVPAAPAADLRRQEAQCTAHDDLLDEPRADHVARQVDDLRAGPAASAAGFGGRRSLPVLRDSWNAVHNEGRMTMRVQMDFTCFAERDDNAMLKEYLRNSLPFFGDDMLRTGRHRRMAGAGRGSRADACGAASGRTGGLALRQRRCEPGGADAGGRAARGRQQGVRHHRPALEREPARQHGAAG